MNRPANLLRRVLTVLLAVTPLLASADLCTVGALTGRSALSCGMESGGPACRVAPVPAPTPKCPHCAPAVPAQETPRSHGGPTCCDLRPQAEAVSGQPALTAPSPAQHPVAALVVAVPVVMTASGFGVEPDDGGAPPGEVPLLRAPRAPPLA